MSTFDQRGQQVGYQFNAAGDINFSNVQSRAEFVEELQKLQNELNRAAKDGVISEDQVIDAEYHLGEAVQEATSSSPNKKTIAEHLDTVIKSVGGATALAKFAQEAAKAIEAANPLFLPSG